MLKNRVVAAGGLGNQLFQWAFAHYLFNKTNKKITLISIDRKEGKAHTKSGLHNLISSCSKVTIINSQLASRFPTLFDPWNSSARRYYRYLGINYDQKEFEIDPSTNWNYYVGYFQNFNYINSNLDHIKTELNLALYAKCATLEQALLGKTVIHVRGGDLTPKSESVNNSTKSYIKNAIVSCNLNKSELPIILTDDPKYADRLTQGIPVSRIIGPDQLSVYESLYIMANSKNLILSSSTLSWWGGFLCSSNGYLVIAPQSHIVSGRIVLDLPYSSMNWIFV